MPLPQRVSEIQKAVDHFISQFRTAVSIQVRGALTNDQGQTCLTDAWLQIGCLDFELDLIGLGLPEDSDEDLCWFIPSGPGELRILSRPDDAESEEEKNEQRNC